VYVFDTNSLSVLFDNFYLARFPSLWEKFDELLLTGRIISVREVYNEILCRHRDTRLVEWAKGQREFFVQPSVEEMQFVGRIFAVVHFRALIRKRETLEGTPVADPFLIAKAKVDKRVLVSQETLKPNAAKIPNVCEHFGVQYTNVGGFYGDGGVAILTAVGGILRPKWWLGGCLRGTEGMPPKAWLGGCYESRGDRF